MLSSFSNRDDENFVSCDQSYNDRTLKYYSDESELEFARCFVISPAGDVTEALLTNDPESTERSVYEAIGCSPRECEDKELGALPNGDLLVVYHNSSARNAAVKPHMPGLRENYRGTCVLVAMGGGWLKHLPLEWSLSNWQEILRGVVCEARGPKCEAHKSDNNDGDKDNDNSNSNTNQATRCLVIPTDDGEPVREARLNWSEVLVLISGDLDHRQLLRTNAVTIDIYFAHNSDKLPKNMRATSLYCDMNRGGPCGTCVIGATTLGSYRSVDVPAGIKVGSWYRDFSKLARKEQAKEKRSELSRVSISQINTYLAMGKQILQGAGENGLLQQHQDVAEQLAPYIGQVCHTGASSVRAGYEHSDEHSEGGQEHTDTTGLHGQVSSWQPTSCGFQGKSVGLLSRQHTSAKGLRVRV